MTKKERLYEIIIINEKTGREYPSGFVPDTHEHCCILMSKMTKYAWRRIMLKEIV